MHPLWLAIRLPRLPLEVLPPAATESTPRNARAEREALKALCAAAYQFSGTVTAQPGAPEDRIRTVWLEVGASLRLLGGLESLLAHIADQELRHLLLLSRHTRNVDKVTEQTNDFVRANGG